MPSSIFLIQSMRSSTYRNLLSPDGTAIITVPACMSLWTNHDDLESPLHPIYEVASARWPGRPVFGFAPNRTFSIWTCPAKLAQHCVESIFSLEAQAARNPSTLSQYGAALVVTRRTRGLVTHAFSDFADDRWRWGVSSPLKSIAAVVLSAGYHPKYRSLRLGGP